MEIKDRFQSTLRDWIKYSLVGITGIGLVGYFVFQARFLLLGPQISFDNTQPIIQHERVVALTGLTRNITKLTLNGRQIFTDPSGQFDEALVLENGYTIATIEAQDRYGRTTRVEREFVYIPATLIP